MLVAFVGRKSSGKSRGADHLVARHGFRKVSPIDPGKRFAEDLGFSHESLWGPSSARELPHPTLTCADGSPLILRTFLDTVSTEVRKLCPTILLARSLRDVGDGGDWVNESLRLRVELDAYRELGAFIIRRKGGIATDDEYDQLADLPDSAFDACIGRMDTLEQLYGCVDALIDGWRAEAGR